MKNAKEWWNSLSNSDKDLYVKVYFNDPKLSYRDLKDHFLLALYNWELKTKKLNK